MKSPSGQRTLKTRAGCPPHKSQVADASKMVQPVEWPEELRKEVIKFSQDHFDELHSDMETIDIVHIIACHFAEWGAAHARKEDK